MLAVAVVFPTPPFPDVTTIIRAAVSILIFKLFGWVWSLVWFINESDFGISIISELLTDLFKVAWSSFLESLIAKAFILVISRE